MVLSLSLSLSLFSLSFSRSLSLSLSLSLALSLSIYIYRKIRPCWMQTTEWNKRRVEMRGGRMLLTDLRVGVPDWIGETQ